MAIGWVTQHDQKIRELASLPGLYTYFLVGKFCILVSEFSWFVPQSLIPSGWKRNFYPELLSVTASDICPTKVKLGCFNHFVRTKEATKKKIWNTSLCEYKKERQKLTPVVLVLGTGKCETTKKRDMYFIERLKKQISQINSGGFPHEKSLSAIPGWEGRWGRRICRACSPKWARSK